MAKPFLDYLIRLAAEPSEMHAFVGDPEGRARENHLSDEHKEALRAGEWLKIKELVEQENPGLIVDSPTFINFGPPLRLSLSTKVVDDQDRE